MDVTDKESITRARDFIAEKEGKLHILVNKLVRISVDSPHSSVLIMAYHTVLAKLVLYLVF